MHLINWSSASVSNSVKVEGLAFRCVFTQCQGGKTPAMISVYILLCISSNTEQRLFYRIYLNISQTYFTCSLFSVSARSIHFELTHLSLESPLACEDTHLTYAALWIKSAKLVSHCHGVCVQVHSSCEAMTVLLRKQFPNKVYWEPNNRDKQAHYDILANQMSNFLLKQKIIIEDKSWVLAPVSSDLWYSKIRR